ncbi:MAG: hypothetical protein ACYTEK_19015, partial [Planctomycetota bacterium]
VRQAQIQDGTGPNTLFRKATRPASFFYSRLSPNPFLQLHSYEITPKFLSILDKLTYIKLPVWINLPRLTPSKVSGTTQNYLLRRSGTPFCYKKMLFQHQKPSNTRVKAPDGPRSLLLGLFGRMGSFRTNICTFLGHSLE